MDEHPGLLDHFRQVGVAKAQAGERDQQVQPGRDALDPGPGQVLAHRGQQGVTSGPLPLADQPDVPLELAGRDQAGQHQLRQRRAPQIGRVLGRDQVRVHPAGRDQPAQPHAGSEGLGGAARVCHLVRGGGLQRRDRRPVVAVFGVVVVLDDQGIGGGCPAQQVAAPPRGQHRPGGELVSRGDQHGPDVAARQLAHLEPTRIHRDRYRAQAPVGQLLAGPARAGVLHRDRWPCLAPKPPGQQGEGLGDAGDDDDVGGLGPQPAGARQPARELIPQPLAATRIAVTQVGHPSVLAVIGPLLEGSRPHGRAVAAAVVVTGGAALVQGIGRADMAGVAWAAVVFACEAGFTLLALPVLRRHGPWGVSVHTTWLAALIFAAGGLAREGPAAAAYLGRPQWLAVGYLAVAVTAAAFVMWYSSVGRLGASRAGLLTGVAPVAAAATGVLLGGPAPRPPVWAGIAVVAVGLALGLRGRRRQERA